VKEYRRVDTQKRDGDNASLNIWENMDDENNLAFNSDSSRYLKNGRMHIRYA
jgi:hypothetical protein